MERVSENRTYESYCTDVCAVLKKATQKEKDALAEELLDHMASHAEALVELGWDPEEARAYAIQAMGDAETVGRQYDEKLSTFWLWCGRVLRTALVVQLAALLLTGVLYLPVIRVYNNLKARWFPQMEYDAANRSVAGKELLIRQELDLLITVEHQRVRIYQLDVYYDEFEDQYQVTVYTVRYAQNPLQYTFLDAAQLEGEYFGTGHGPIGVSYYNHGAVIEPGQESVTLTILRIGEDIEVEIPIEWEVIP